VTNTLTRDPRPAASTDWRPSPAPLSMNEREEIRAGLERDETSTAIAGSVERAVTAVSRELATNGGRPSRSISIKTRKDTPRLFAGHEALRGPESRLDRLRRRGWGCSGLLGSAPIRLRRDGRPVVSEVREHIGGPWEVAACGAPPTGWDSRIGDLEQT
jgi:hypothetical protein